MSRCTNVFFVQAILLAILAHSAASADAAGRAQTTFKYELNDLGVHYIQIYAWAPVNGTKEAVHLKLWLKRIIGDEKQQQPTGAARQPSFLLPSQQHHVVEGIGWAEDLATFKKYRYGKIMMPVDIIQWKPLLLLELSDGSTVRALYDWQDRNNTLNIDRRPFFFYFVLPRYNISSCFKVIEETVPDIKMPVCLPESAASLCDRLAPPDRYTPSNPALWTAMIPFRSVDVPGPKWEDHLIRSANRLHHYITHTHRVGGSGVLLYTNRFTAEGMAPYVQELLRNGSLVFVAWDQLERPKYHYDQAHVYTHAFLGLAACGTNLWLQATDIDELLYDRDMGRLWPDMLRCMKQSAKDEQAAMFSLSRFDVVASHLKDGEDADLWSALPKPGVKHPLEVYDKMASRPMPIEEGKVLACPAYRIVGVWVHFATLVHGRQYIADSHCGFLLHVQKYWVPREYTLKGYVNSFGELGPTMYGPNKRVVMGESSSRRRLLGF